MLYSDYGARIIKLFIAKPRLNYWQNDYVGQRIDVCRHPYKDTHYILLDTLHNRSILRSTLLESYGHLIIRRQDTTRFITTRTTNDEAACLLIQRES
jgi:hypothetical protein